MPEPSYEKAVVIGDGSWGTTLAITLAKKGVATSLWSAFPEQVAEMREARENKRYLAGIPFPDSLSVTADPFEAAEGAEVAVSVVPTQYLRGVIEKFEDALPGTVPVVTATKGLEIETFHSPSEIIREVLGERAICVLSGPSHAEEVAREKPVSLVAACPRKSVAKRVQATFSTDFMRVYTNDDPLGAEIGGALKNVVAIAAGISDGLELGDNAKAALLTRGIVEIARFGKAQGAKETTFFGLAGIGDLITTCCSVHSRNRAVGERIGRGETLEQVIASMEMVAEGVWTTKALFGPESEAKGTSMPIAEQVHAVLFEGKAPLEAVNDLMTRAPAEEMEGLLLAHGRD